MRLELAGTGVVDTVASQWVELADEQVQYGSHVRGDRSREQIRDEIARHAVTDTLLVARSERDDEAIVGFAMFSLERGTFEKAVQRGIVEAIYVVPDRRDEGIGSALLRAAETHLLEAGADRLSLESLADNDDARRFYRRHGYEPHRVEHEKEPENDNHSKEGGKE
jgi:ribosomal protein S18 acetylase RimI-like enzyme